MDAPLAIPALIEQLRADLAGCTVDTVEALLGPVAHAALAREQPWAARWRVSGAGPGSAVLEPSQEPLAALVAVFVLGLAVPVRRLEAALPRLGVPGAVRLGLVRTAGPSPDDEVRARVDLRPYGAVDTLGTADWWAVSDLSEHAAPGPLRPDHVLGVGGASMTLARCAFRRPVGSVLDLGTGCGVQALHASRHADDVTATDVSARALRFARFTLALNDVPAQLLRGDLLEPVAGRTFDQVVSNPPFVITPRTPQVPRYDYRDGGDVGDGVVRSLITRVGDVLAPGGTAQLLGNWEHRRGEPWQERVGAWLDASGLDGWVVQREVQDPAEYAELWIRDGGHPDPADYATLYRAWLDDFAGRDVEGIGFGLVLLRRPEAGRPRVRRLEEVRSGGETALGDHLARCLDAQVRLAGLTDAALGDLRLVVAPDVTDERYHRPGEEDPEVLLLRQGGGFGRSVRSGTELAAFTGACDGELTVGRIVGALALLLERPADEIATGLLPAVRGLLADGLLTW